MAKGHQRVAVAARVMSEKIKGYGGKGWGKGKGKKGGGKGVYGLDLMGSESWGSECDWGGDSSWGGDSWVGQTSYDGSGYLRSLAVLIEAPAIAISNSFNALDDDNTFSVSVFDLVVTPKRKLSNKVKNKKRFDTRNCSSSLCLSSSCCSTHPSTAVGPGGVLPPAEDGR